MAKVLLLLLCGALFVETAVDIRKKKVLLRKLDQCKGQENLALRWYDFKSSHNEQTGDTIFSVKAELKREISTDLAIVFNFWKCDASGNPDSCEQIVKDYNVSDICTYMVAKGEAWTPFMERFTTPMACPLKKGVYEAKDIKVSPDFLNYIPIGDAVWKVQMEGYDKGVKINCVQFVLQIVPMYVRRKH